MSNLSSRLGAFSLMCLTIGGTGQLAFPSSAAAQTADTAAATAAVQAAASSSRENARPDDKNRRLAPRGTFYLLTYVSAKTDKGVEGFVPGQEVHLVEVHPSTHTLVVGNERAQVEVPPSKLTNDLDIAEMARQKDETHQTRVAAYIRAEEAAYSRAQSIAAEATAKDLERRDQAQQELLARQQAQADAAAAKPNAIPDPPVQSSNTVDNGYYNDGGYGYGNPYSYFTGGGGQQTIIIAPQTPASPATPATSAPAPGRVAVPPAAHPPVGRPK